MRLALIVFFLAGGAVAQPPDTSLRPNPRAAVVEIAEPQVPAPVISSPSPRVAAFAAPAPASAMMSEATISALAAAFSLRPTLRPPSVVERAVAVRRQRQRGAVCGDPDIQGDPVGRVAGRVAGCGVADAVRVRSIAGVELTQRSVMDCRTAAALTRWLQSSAKPALSGLGGGLARLKVAAHYACRTRNNQSGTRISEHGKGRAIDISGFHMRDGSLITVEQGWTARETRRALRQMHRGACRTFGTVLGPDADRFHRDHFHFDTARYRSGSYCR